MPRRMRPTITAGGGPKRSTRYLSTGTNQVSSKTKTENATWIEARPQWNLASIGFTNSVQPYCRFAIMAMQMMPITSCTHRYAVDFLPSHSWTISGICPSPPLIVFLRLGMEQPISRSVNIPSGSLKLTLLSGRLRRAGSQDLVEGCIRYEREPARDVVWYHPRRQRPRGSYGITPAISRAVSLRGLLL